MLRIKKASEREWEEILKNFHSFKSNKRVQYGNILERVREREWEREKEILNYPDHFQVSNFFTLSFLLKYSSKCDFIKFL
jgi:hypothetical protein